MIRALEASLRRLRTDYVDLFLLHVWDRVTPVEEVVRTFDDLTRAGKIRYAGLSDELRAELDAAGAVPPGYPYGMCTPEFQSWQVSSGVRVGDKPPGYRPPVRNWVPERR